MKTSSKVISLKRKKIERKYFKIFKKIRKNKKFRNNKSVKNNQLLILLIGIPLLLAIILTIDNMIK